MQARCKRVWTCQLYSKQQMYVWRAVPPSEEFVSLGIVCTTSENPPAPDTMRCVHRSWIKVSEVTPVKVWDDSGSWGQKGSFRIVNSLNLLCVTEGHEAPVGPFFDLITPKFQALDHHQKELIQIRNLTQKMISRIFHLYSAEIQTPQERCSCDHHW